MAEPVAGAALLSVSDLARWFELSPPLVERLIEGRQRLWLKAVDGVSFAIARGKCLALVGESGSGKSTVARLVTGLERPTRGTVAFAGETIGAPGMKAASGKRRARLQMIFQDPYASLNPRWRVRDIVGEPLRVAGSHRGAALAARVAELLAAVGLHADDGERYPHEFSGGQRQRISIARALAAAPELLVCDEPTSALDVSVQAQILNLMKDLQRALDLTYLFISHNLAVVYHVADTVGVMYLGRIVELADTRSLFAAPLHPYTRVLLDTVPDVSLSGRRREPVAGEVPSPLDPPAGCAFHPRCPLADERCRRERPELKTELEAGGGHLVACHAVAEGRLPPWRAPAQDRAAQGRGERGA